MIIMKKHRKKRLGRGAGTGWGSKKKHRGKGSKGGKGFGGSTKHNRSFVYTKNPYHFGHRGFYRHMKKEIKTINISEIEKLTKDEKIDLKKLGFDKLLGNGKIEKPLKIKIDYFSVSAKRKIEESGGSIETTNDKI